MVRRFRSSFFPCAAAFFLAPLFAQTSKTLDLSTVGGSRRHYVVFAARGGSATGHAFVLWGVEDDALRTSAVKAFGLYPANTKDNCGSVYRTVPGAIQDEFVNHSIEGITEELIVRVDEDAFDQSWKAARQWGCNHEFSLLSRDCVEFLRAAGTSLYLNMPSRFVTRWSPRSYVRALLDSVSNGVVEFNDATYEGSLMDGRPMGHGVLTYKDDSRIEGTFWGRDRHVGSGVLRNAEAGFRYEGGIRNYAAHGFGTLSAADSAGNWKPVLSGTFENGELSKPSRSRAKALREFGRIELVADKNGLSR
jgi:hypothetical protein